MQDPIDPIVDEILVNFVIGSHMRSVATREMNRGLVIIPEQQRQITNCASEYHQQKQRPIPQGLLQC